jgi:predicted dehydrogenase
MQAEGATLRLGVLGLGSVFTGPYRQLINQLRSEGRAELTAVFDLNAQKTAAVAAMYPGIATPASAGELIGRADVDAVLVLTSMNEHGALATAALQAGKHVLVEKPMATSLTEAHRLLDVSRQVKGMLVCAPHVVLSPTYRAIHAAVHAGHIGRLVLARSRYGWAGPWWGDWFYQPGGGALFDLGVYNLTSLCGFFGSVKRVCAMVGTAIPRRMSEGGEIAVQADDNAQVLLDFGDSRFGSITTGFTMQKYRGPAIELYGTQGVLQLLGDDWAPQGFEEWSNQRQVWELHEESDPQWPWTAGLRHLVDCVAAGRPTVSRPEHALHCLEVMQAARSSSAEGRYVQIESQFPALDYTGLPAAGADQHRRQHDPRTS